MRVSASPLRSLAPVFAATWLRAASIGAVAACTLTVGAPDACAQSASDLAAAKQLFSEGLKLEEAGKWSDAKDRFQKVEAIKPTPQVTFHMGLCSARSGELVEAVVWLERAKERAQQARLPDVEAAADAELKSVRPRVPTIELVFPKDAAVVRVAVDGEQSRSAASGAPMLVNPGEHEVAVEFATGTVKKKFKVAEKDAAKLAFEAPKGSATASVASVAPVAPVAPATSASVALGTTPEPARDEGASSGGKSKVLPWILVGGGVAAAAGGVVLMLTSVAKFRDVCPDVCPRSKEQEAKDARDSAVVPYYAGVSLVGVGAAAAVVGVVLFATSGGSGSVKSAATSPAAPRALAMPLVFPGGGGMGFSGAF